uniref:Uncharacterized protein n=1 Tax=Anguilla anguilla TaxID=7936 RepID=A0A0E9Q6K1_ANGAN
MSINKLRVIRQLLFNY